MKTRHASFYSLLVHHLTETLFWLRLRELRPCNGGGSWNSCLSHAERHDTHISIRGFRFQSSRPQTLQSPHHYYIVYTASYGRAGVFPFSKNYWSQIGENRLSSRIKLRIWTWGQVNESTLEPSPPKLELYAQNSNPRTPKLTADPITSTAKAAS